MRCLTLTLGIYKIINMTMQYSLVKYIVFLKDKQLYLCLFCISSGENSIVVFFCAGSLFFLNKSVSLTDSLSDDDSLFDNSLTDETD